MRIKLVTVILCLSMAAMLISGCGPAIQDTKPDTTPDTNAKAPHTISLAQSIIDTAIKAVKDQPNWCISLLDPTLNLLTGVAVEGAIVLHNGDDAERMVTLYYSPAEDSKVKYVNDEPVTSVPVDASRWVTISEPNVRLALMETRTITITVYIPNGTKIENKNFRFNITADAGMIVKQMFNMDITTDATTKDSNGNAVPDNFLEASLGMPLMLNSLTSITKLTSSIGEKLTAVSYDPKSMLLRIEGLKTSSTRTIALEYETTGMFRQAYIQNWYVSMR
jgi:hypothetical protein